MRLTQHQWAQIRHYIDYPALLLLFVGMHVLAPEMVPWSEVGGVCILLIASMLLQWRGSRYQ